MRAVGPFPSSPRADYRTPGFPVQSLTRSTRRLAALKHHRHVPVATFGSIMEWFLILVLLALATWLFFKLRSARHGIDRLQREKNELTKARVELEAKNAVLETEHLKFQLQPHTLNNILSNLKIISSKLSKGMDALSETLDYILYKGRTNLVSVEEEMEFVKTYLRLNDLFLSEVDAIHVDVDKVDRSSRYFGTLCIPHLISAYFIENAFKHGDTRHPEFLRIRVSLDQTTFQLHVTNRIGQKAHNKPGGLGLQNMKKRLDLLMQGKHVVHSNSTEEEYHAILTIQFQP
jgi:two-component system, LytTR family, sensor kinase